MSFTSFTVPSPLPSSFINLLRLLIVCLHTTTFRRAFTAMAILQNFMGNEVSELFLKLLLLCLLRALFSFQEGVIPPGFLGLSLYHSSFCVIVFG